MKSSPPGSPSVGYGPKPLVPVVTTSGELPARLREEQVLLSATILQVSTWRLMRGVAAEADVGVLDASTQRLQGLELLRFSASYPHCSLVVLENPRSAATRDDSSGRLPAQTEFVSWNREDLSELAMSVARARVRGWSNRIRDQILRNEHVPYVVRLALREALKAEAEDRPSLTKLAREIGVSRSHLSRTAHASGVQLLSVVDAWSVVQSVALRWYSDLTWSRVAWRLGYASLSGLSDLLHRSTGVRIREVASHEPEAWFAWFDREVLEPVLEPDDVLEHARPIGMVG